MRSAIFPSLAYVVADDQFNHPYSFSFGPDSMLSLNFLKLNNFCPFRAGALLFPPDLRILDMTFEIFGFRHISLTLPSEKLTVLLLHGNERGWTPTPATLHFPHLVSLSLATVQPTQLLITLSPLSFDISVTCIILMQKIQSTLYLLNLKTSSSLSPNSIYTYRLAKQDLRLSDMLLWTHFLGCATW
ncbi:hypothetical protein F5J12DRAFT_841200 [Pisolithus orientalis]|uniref:uncharacterized protein n=1 Tax=Pisolithus orientalis TaxID=936130 RepID=UPI0022255B25|nr:uncharacterized protein F5J12DRAFT_841200 [Pisolithus orientalis]KAI6002464.1 hypothetical protein F5J12DRAFT_841200 [Pisolithus orientalis]